MSTITVSDAPGLRGDLAIFRREAASGRVLDVWEKKNVIVYDAGTSLARLIAPNLAFGATIQQESQIKSMRFGESNVAPQRSDTDLAAEAISGGNPVRLELVDASRVHGGAGIVEFVALMDAVTGNGLTYREAGLFTRGTADDPLLTTASKLFARQVFPDQAKTAIIELEFRWRITFTV